MSGTYVYVDATAAVQSWLSGTTNSGFIVTPNDSNINVAFDSKESTTTSHPATLSILLSSNGPAGPTGATGASGVGLVGATGRPGVGATGAHGRWRGRGNRNNGPLGRGFARAYGCYGRRRGRSHGRIRSIRRGFVRTYGRNWRWRGRSHGCFGRRNHRRDGSRGAPRAWESRAPPDRLARLVFSERITSAASSAGGRRGGVYDWPDPAEHGSLLSCELFTGRRQDHSDSGEFSSVLDHRRRLWWKRHHQLRSPGSEGSGAKQHAVLDLRDWNLPVTAGGASFLRAANSASITFRLPRAFSSDTGTSLSSRMARAKASP